MKHLAIWMIAGAMAVTAAAAIATLSEDQHRTALSRIDSLHTARAVDEAAAYVAPLLHSARAENDSALILPLAAKLGRLWAAFGQPARGEPLLVEAAELATALRDTSRLVDALRWLGYSIDLQGRAGDARAIYRRLLAASVDAGDRRHEGWARVGLAYQAWRDRQEDEAAAQYRLAAALFRQVADGGAEVWALNGLGAVLQDMGKHREAQAIYRQVAEEGRAIGYGMVEALGENNLGTIEFAIGDPGVALAHFTRAEELQTSLQLWQEVVTTGSNLALCQAALGRLDEAAARFEELLVLCRERRIGDREAHLIVQLAGLRRQQGRPREAISIYRELLGRDSDVVGIRQRVEGSVGLAYALADVDSGAAGLEVLLAVERRWTDVLRGELQLELVLAVGERLMSTGQYAPALARLRTGFALADSLGLHRYTLGALTGQARCLRALARPDSALAVLRSAVAVWGASRAAPLDREWREERGAAGRLVYSQLAALLAGDPAAAFTAVQGFKARTLAERIGTEALAEVVTLGHVQGSVLRDGEVLLDYYLGPQESVLFAVTRTEVRVVLLPPEPALVPRLRVFWELVAAPAVEVDDPELLTADGQRLGQLLLGSALPLMAHASHVIVVPDGPLNLIPFATLGVTAPGAAWSRTPSTSILAAQRTGTGMGAAPSVASGILALAGTRGDNGQDLRGAQDEVRRLAARYQGVATHLDSVVVLPRFALLHLASHARLDDQRPWTSYIELAVGDSVVPLRADAVAALPLRAHLAVLSACATAGGRVLSGEGVLGLSSAFLAAGVPTVVASLWPVGDALTASLMDRFYKRLAAGATVAGALAEAQAELQVDPATSAPFAWAAFVVVGDGAQRVVIARRQSLAWPLVTAALVIGALAARWLRRRNSV